MKKVKQDKAVDIITILAAKEAFDFIPLAIIKLLTAAGDANSINSTPKSAPLNPKNKAGGKDNRGTKTVFISDAESAIRKLSFILAVLRNAPMVSSANGVAMSAI